MTTFHRQTADSRKHKGPEEGLVFCYLIDSIEADVTLRFRYCRGLGGGSEAVRTCPDDGRCSAQGLGTAHPSYQAAKPFRAVNDRLWVLKKT